jgi:apolipoprotein N-acyltransferase
VLFALLSAALLAVCFPPYNLWWVAWFALVPFLLALEGAKPFHARLVGFLWGAAFYGFSARWLFSIFGFPAVALIGILALGPWLFGQAYVSARRRLPGGWSWVALPVLWVGIEYFRSECWYFKFAWFGLGYSQTPYLPTLQWAMVSGCYSLSLLIAVANALLARAVSGRHLRVAAAACVVAVASVALGEAMRLIAHERQHRAASDYGASSVALVQDESSDLDRMLELSTASLADRPGLIVWPEYAVMDDPLTDWEQRQKIADLARDSRAHVVVGCKRYVDAQHRRFHNAAVVFGPEGQVFGEYHKANPVQFFDDGIPGRSFPTFETPFGELGIAICYDMDFPWVMRKLVQNGAEILVVPTYDAMWWGRLQHQQHSAMTAMRAVEHRRWIVRAASSGESQVVDSVGRVHARLGIGRTGTMVRAVWHHEFGMSPYDRGGWLLAPVCLALTCVLFFWDAACTLRNRRRRPKATGL